MHDIFYCTVVNIYFFCDKNYCAVKKNKSTSHPYNNFCCPYTFLDVFLCHFGRLHYGFTPYILVQRQKTFVRAVRNIIFIVKLMCESCGI